MHACTTTNGTATHQVLLKRLLEKVPGRVEKAVLARLISYPAFSAIAKWVATSLNISLDNKWAWNWGAMASSLPDFTATAVGQPSLGTLNEVFDALRWD